MKNLIMYKKGEHSFIRWIKKRIANNLNFIGLFQGATGVGKTWSAISVSQIIDPEFSVDQIVFDFQELMEVINQEWFLKKKWKIIIFDEPQITISNRNWQSTTNKMMNYLLSTFRHQNVILIFCSPYVDFLDSQSTKLLHTIFECQGVNRKKDLSRVVPKIQQYNSAMRKTYQHPLYVIKGKKTTPLREWWIPKPSEALIELYEQKKTTFTSKLNQEIKEKLEELTTKKKKSEDPVGEGLKDALGYDPKGRKLLTEMQLEVLKLRAQGLSNQEVCRELGIPETHGSRHVRFARNKGYTAQEFKDVQ